MFFRRRKLVTIAAVFSVLLSALVLPATVMADNKVVVIPLSGTDQKPIKNVITVAKENGDFTDPIAAMLSITDASATNPYLMVIAPGVYNLTQNRRLQTKSYVDVVGGGQNSTVLRGNTGSNSTIFGSGSLVYMVENSSISNLTLENLDTSLGRGYGVYATGSVSLSNITINISSSSNSRLVGLRTINASTKIVNSKINVSAGSGGESIGISNSASSPSSTSTLRMLSTQIEVGGIATNKRGVRNVTSRTSAKINNSNINVPSGVSVSANSGSGVHETYISDSILSGPAAGAKCSFVFTLTGNALNDNCL